MSKNAEAKFTVSAVDKTKEAFTKISQNINSVERNFSMLSGTVARLGGILAGAFIGGSLVDSITKFERLEASLRTVTGSAEKAKDAFNLIQGFASTTPFSLDQVTEGFIKLKALGLDPSERAMTSYGNTASAMGKSLEQMIEAVADATTGEFERLKEFGIKAKSEGDRVTFTFQGISTTIGKNSKEIQDYLSSIGEVQFAGAMADQAGTLNLAISNMGDGFSKLAKAIGDAGLTNVLLSASKAISGVADSITKSLAPGETFRSVVDGMSERAASMGASLTAFAAFMAGRYVFAMGKAVAATAALSTSFATLRVALIKSGIGIAVIALGEAIYRLGILKNEYSESTDNVSKALGDEIERTRALSADISNGSILYKDAARAKLEEALARYQNAQAARDEHKVIAMQSREYKQILEEIQAKQSEIDNVSISWIGVSDSLYDYIERLKEQAAKILETPDGLTGQIAAAKQNIDDLQKLINDSKLPETAPLMPLLDKTSLEKAFENLDRLIKSSDFDLKAAKIQFEYDKDSVARAAALAAAEFDKNFNKTDFSGADPEVQKQFQRERARFIAKAKERAQLDEEGRNRQRFIDKSKESYDSLKQGADGLTESLLTPLQKYRVELEKLDIYKKEGLISSEVYKKAIERLNNTLPSWSSGLKQYADAAQNASQSISDSLSSAFSSADSAFRNFIENGKFEFKGFVRSIIADLATIHFRKSITGPLASALGGASGGGISGSLIGGIGAFLSSFDGGGYTGNGPRSGGIDGRGGFPAILHPNESVIDHTRGQSVGGNAPVFNISIDAKGAQQGVSGEIINKLRPEFERMVVGVIKTQFARGAI